MAPPRIKVVLLARTDIELSLWRMRLDLAGYAVLATLNPAEAAKIVRADFDVRLVVSQVSTDTVIASLKCGGRVKVLVIDGHAASRQTTLAEGFLLPAESTPYDVIKRVNLLSARRRGPRKFLPAVADAPQASGSLEAAVWRCSSSKAVNGVMLAILSFKFCVLLVGKVQGDAAVAHGEAMADFQGERGAGAGDQLAHLLLAAKSSVAADQRDQVALKEGADPYLVAKARPGAARFEAHVHLRDGVLRGRWKFEIRCHDTPFYGEWKAKEYPRRKALILQVGGVA